MLVLMITTSSYNLSANYSLTTTSELINELQSLYNVSIYDEEQMQGGLLLGTHVFVV